TTTEHRSKCRQATNAALWVQLTSRRPPRIVIVMSRLSNTTHLAASRILRMSWLARQNLAATLIVAPFVLTAGLFVSASALAATSVSGSITVNTTWFAANSPYAV